MNKEVNNNKTKAAINSAVSRSDEVIEIEENDKSLLIVWEDFQKVVAELYLFLIEKFKREFLLHEHTKPYILFE